MCGIYAVVKKRGTFGKDQGEILFNLGVITTLRGWDGSGVAAVNQKGKSTSLKIGSDFNHLIRSEPWNKFLDDIKNSKVSFGHARAATVGNVNTDNAHPFVYKSVTLVHNGTLEDKYVSRVSGDLKFEVDSNVLAKVLKENEDDVCQVLKTIDGAFALMWHNTNNNTFYVARNHQRPLFYADLHSCFVFSSEKDFLEFALKRTKNYEVNCIKEVIAGRLFEFNISKDDALEICCFYNKAFKYDRKGDPIGTFSFENKQQHPKHKDKETYFPELPKARTVPVTYVKPQHEMANDEETVIPGMYWGDSVFIDVIETKEKENKYWNITGTSDLFPDAIFEATVSSEHKNVIIAEMLKGRPLHVTVLDKDNKQYPNFVYKVSLGCQRVFSTDQIESILRKGVVDADSKEIKEYNNFTVSAGAKKENPTQTH